LLALGLVAVLTAGVAVGGGDKKQADKLQGTWVVEKDGKKAATMIFTKDTFALTMRDGDKEATFKGTYTTDPSKKPRQMDMKINEGPMFAGDTSKAIYEVDGDTLKWNAGTPGKGERPTGFPDKEGAGGQGMYLMFKRAK
jgi:uncharacterized protein (TIGR03067 family)